MLLYLGYIFLTAGCIAIICGIIGLLRFPDFFTKAHAASVIDCCGVPLSLVGLACLQSNSGNIFKILLICALILLLSPVTSHALFKAAWLNQNKKHDD